MQRGSEEDDLSTLPGLPAIDGPVEPRALKGAKSPQVFKEKLEEENRAIVKLVVPELKNKGEIIKIVGNYLW